MLNGIRPQCRINYNLIDSSHSILASRKFHDFPSPKRKTDPHRH